eukprot:Skav235174  [mRNA]  locus=scaffold721:193370:199816:- [translate_table: standard]
MSAEFTSSLGAPMMEDIGRRRSNEAMERVASMVRTRSRMLGLEDDEPTPVAKEPVSYEPPPRQASTPSVTKPKSTSSTGFGKPTTGRANDSENNKMEGAIVHFVTDLNTELMLHYGSGDAYNKRLATKGRGSIPGGA